MLTPILGRARSGKSARLYRLIDERGSAGRRCLLIVPEQFSFEAEKLVLQNCSAEAAARTDVCSFSRLADKLIERYSPERTPYITDRGRTMLMELALDDLWDRLAVYGKVRDRRKLTAQLIAADLELRQACVSPESLSALVLDEQDAALKKKLDDLALILSVYHAQVGLRYSDRTSDLPRAAELFEAHPEEHDRAVFIDEFSGFTADELTLLERLIGRCPEVFVTFCVDTENAGGCAAFDLPRKSFNDVLSLAKRAQVRIGAPIRMNDLYYGSPLLAHCERELFDVSPERYEGGAGDVTVCKCAGIAEECEFAAISAKKLIVENGWRCSDIAVIERGTDCYGPDLTSAFARCGLAVFRDVRRSIAWSGAASYILAFAENALSGISTDAVLRMLRSGMTDLADDEIDRLDNYLYMFEIDGGEWTREWRYDPRGFGDEMNDEAAAELRRLNEIRASLVSSFTSFRERVKGGACGEILRALYDRLLSVGADGKTKHAATLLAGAGDNDEAQTVLSAYNALIECFSDIFDAIGDRYLAPKRFFELFSEAVNGTNVGVAPQELDAVTVGSADRVRLRDKKAIVVVGVNENVFPAPIQTGGIFSDSERRAIAAAGAQISGDTDYLAARERYLCYRAFSHASDRLFLTYSVKDISQSRLEPSELVSVLKKILPAQSFTELADVPAEDRVAGRESAFRFLASHWFSQETTVSALIAYFNANGGAERLAGIERLARRSAPKLSARAARMLYGDTVTVTPSRLEKFYSCRFSHFCEYGMRAKERRRAELTAAQNGSAVHYVLECVFNEYGSAGVARLTDAEKREAVRKYTAAYADRFMTGLADRSLRMKYIVDRYADVVFVVLSRLSDEFSRSGFVTADTELEIGMPGVRDALPPYFVRDADGFSVGVRGKIDRVDLFRHGDDTYLRVVDYKTNSKDFRFGDVPNGFNLQMLIYLMALWKNGGRRYGGKILPAGVLYVPAELGELENTRGDAYQARMLKNGKMSGLLLNDPVSLDAMNAADAASYLPVRVKDGAVSGAAIDLAQFRNLHALIDRKIAEMGKGLRDGDISAAPVVDGRYDPCTYCVYRGACLRDLTERALEPAVLSDEEMGALLSDKEGNDDE